MLEKIVLVIASVFLPASVSFAGNFDVGLNYAAGISEKKGLNTSFDIQEGSFSLSGGFKYSKQDGKTSQDNLGLSLGYDANLGGKWALWMFNFSEYDRVQKINFENSFGAGPKYTFINSKNLVLSFSGGPMQYHADYETAKSRNSLRLSGRFKMGWIISPDMRFNVLSFYQPNLADHKDYLTRTMADLSHTITKTVSLKLKLEDYYRSRTEAQKHNDFSSTLALSVNF